MKHRVFITRTFSKDVENLQPLKRELLGRKLKQVKETGFERVFQAKPMEGAKVQHVMEGRVDKAFRLIWLSKAGELQRVLLFVGGHDETLKRGQTFRGLIHGPQQLDSDRLAEDVVLRRHDTKSASCHDSVSVKYSQNTDQAAVNAHSLNTVPCDIDDTSEASLNLEHEDVFELEIDELIRFAEGELKTWMLFLPKRHREFVTRRFQGPARVSGVAGSGKTAILLHRARWEAQESPGKTVLVTCFNNALASVISQLLDELCIAEKETRARIEVKTLYALAAEYATGAENREGLLRRCMSDLPLPHLRARFQENTPKFIANQIKLFLKGDPRQSTTSYRDMAPATAKKLTPAMREEVILAYEGYEKARKARRLLDFEDLMLRACEESDWSPLRPQLAALLVDEYQDFSPAALCFIGNIGKACNGRIFFSGDERQRLYSSRDSFRALGFEVTGRSLRLDQSYRNTVQIDAVAKTLADRQVEDEEGTSLRPDRSGPMPVLAGFKGSHDAEVKWLAKKICSLVAEGAAYGDIGVLAPNWEFRSHIESALAAEGVPFFVLSGATAHSFFSKDHVKVSTYHQAKGVEFKIVFCSGQSSDLFRHEYQYNAEEDGKARLQSLLYMAMTRASRQVFISFTKTPLRWLCELSGRLFLCEPGTSAESLLDRGLIKLIETSARPDPHAQASLDLSA